MLKTTAKTLTLSLFLSLTALAQQPQRDPCIKIRIAIDIGSGSSKMRSGIVDACKQTVIYQVSKQSAPIAWKDHLSRPNTNMNFEAQFLSDGVTTIAGLLTKLKEDTKSKLASDAKYADYSYLKDTQPEVFGVCTEAFRQAKNTKDFLSAMRGQGIPVRVLSQQEEGRLGFIGVMTDPKIDVSAKQYLSWDIGGASLQVVGYVGKDAGATSAWQEFGNRLASNPMRVFVVKEIQKKEASTTAPSAKDPAVLENVPTSPNPVLPADGTLTREDLYQRAQQFAAQQMADLLSADWMKQRLSSNTKIYGIGGVHGGILMLLKNFPGYAKATGYSQQDLEMVLNATLSKTDKEITAEFKVPAAFTLGTVTNVLLVYSVMKAFNIESISVADVDNTLGTMVSSKFWKSFPALEAKALVNP